ncbi:YczE/YyaS/YitT family protein [Bacillus marinisedimentorum]|uniref:YczE/YyaS/YitT family protein n=1 Tax=Bacillus marinisedimentorum TaxID=1821260 RepID=UPI0009F4DF7D|nr:hypothetical protein [Bacillus marinisedimentorum]
MSIYFVGIIILAFGTSLMLEVKHLGIAPWDVLTVGLVEHFGLTFGTWNMMIGLVLVGIVSLVNRALIHIGTVMNTLLIGPMVDFYRSLEFIPVLDERWEQYFLLIAGILLNGFGSGMYVAARLGAGPRDGVLLTLSQKLNMSTPKTRLMLESSILIIGIIIGGPFFLGTLLVSPLLGPVFSFSNTRWGKIRTGLEKSHPKLTHSF